jgi:hypothetical protein
MRQTALLPLRRKACWGFFRTKNPTASAGFEPANLGTKGQHATSRPPKLLSIYCIVIFQNNALSCLLYRAPPKISFNIIPGVFPGVKTADA